MKKITLALAVAVITLTGCAYKVSMMPRDSGKIYTGVFNNNGSGSGSMTVDVDGVTYSGPVVKVGSNDTFGFAQTFGYNSKGVVSSSTGTGASYGDVFIKALLTSPDGKGMRCDLRGRGTSGGGICVDDQQRVYDVVATMQ